LTVCSAGAAATPAAGVAFAYACIHTASLHRQRRQASGAPVRSTKQSDWRAGWPRPHTYDVARVPGAL